MADLLFDCSSFVSAFPQSLISTFLNLLFGLQA